MTKLIGTLVIIAVCIAALGFYRGWFSVTQTDTGPLSEKIELGLTVDPEKARNDVQIVKDEVADIGKWPTTGVRTARGAVDAKRV